jgi:CRISPR-associated protein Cmr2
MSELRTIEFSIAPVQAFVSQARRTRDYWAGSYLLSYLTAHAMYGVSGGDPKVIRFPCIEEDPLWLAVSEFLSGGSVQENGPLIASLPNRFTAVCADPEKAGKDGGKALQEAWERIVIGVWEKIRKLLPQNGLTGLPELNSPELPSVWKKQIDNLWEVYWVDEGPEATATWGEGMNQRKNWRKPLFWEERGEMCTVCGERVVAFGAGQFRSAVQRIWHEGTNSIRKAINSEWKLALEDGDRERLCSVCLIKRIFPHIANEVLGWGLKDQVHFPSTHEFAAQMGKDEQGEPLKPYYAILLMDGDKLGQKLRDCPENRESISRAMSGFSRKTPEIVEKTYNGRVVYAGGDDVLAFLPLQHALSCASALRSEFMHQQEQHLEKLKITISAAILMVHMMSPLQPILKVAHQLLDDIAKDGVGRDAFVLQVQKRNGPTLTVAKPWQIQNATGGSNDWPHEIIALSETVFPAEASSYSARFLYKMAALLQPVGDGSEGFIPFDEEKAVKLMTSEYLSNRELEWSGEFDQKQIEKQMERLYKLIRWENRPNGKTVNGKLQIDALELLHFLAKMEVKQ